MPCESDCPVSSPGGWWRNPLFSPLLAVAVIPVLALALRAAGLGGGGADRAVAISFDDVPGSRVCDARRDSLLPALLERGQDAGHTLGNHTFSHRDLNDVSLDWYPRDLEVNPR